MGCRIQIAQLNLFVGDVAGNADRVIAAAARARDDGVDLLVFPELTLTGYPPEDLLLRPELLQRVERALERIRAECRGVTLVLGYPLHAVGGLFNVAGVLRDGEIIGEYAKQHLPNYGVFDEKRYFQAGAAPLVVEHLGLKIGLSVCEDIWQEDPTRQAVEAGAQILININASPFHAGKRAEREALVMRRASEHGIPILYANLVGGQDELVFDGASFVADRAGRILHRAAVFEEALLTLDLDDEGQPIATAFDGGTSSLEGSAMDLDASVYGALVLGVRDYVRKNGFSGAVLGLSGGVDSALTLAIAVDALGADAVEGVLMPSRYTSEMSNSDALAEAESLGVKTHLISIEPAFNSLDRSPSPAGAETPEGPSRSKL